MPLPVASAAQPRPAAASLLLLLPLLLSSLASAQPYVSQLDPWGRDGIRVRLAPAGGAIYDPPLRALLASAPAGTPAGVASADGLTLTVGNLRVSLDAASSLVTATRLSDGAPLLAATALSFSAPDVPGARAGAAAAAITFAGAPGEKIYGLGEHRTGSVQMSPFSRRFADSQDYSQSHGGDVSIPWFASSRGYGFVWNNAAYGSVSISESAIEWRANATMNIDVWLTTTPADFDPAAGASPYAPLLANYVDAVGHAPPMPFYATSFIQCKDRCTCMPLDPSSDCAARVLLTSPARSPRTPPPPLAPDRNQSQLLDVARGYVSRGLPISVIVIDWQHWLAQGDWAFNPTCWPDPQGMVDELKTLGIEPMVTFWPFQTTQSKHWQEYSTTPGFLVRNISGALNPYDGDQYLIDSTSAAVRENAFAHFWEGYGRYGFKTVWMDAAEPEHFGGAAEGTWRLSEGTDGEVMGAWLQQHVRIFADGFASKGIAASDYFVLPRHAWAGSWQYSAALWSGDIASTFDELALQIKVLQGVMMSGVALWTTDIGGYFGGNPADPVFQDLIVRWFQFGAFCPLFRLHGHRDGGPPADECGGTNGDNEVWNLAQEPAHYAGIEAVMRLRENLRSYTAEINAVTAATGLPMVRPMFLQFPLDPLCAGADVEDQFMYGPDWLVAPVYSGAGAASRSVYLPRLANATWVYFFNDSDVGAGGARVEMPTPIGEFPLFYVRDTPPPPPLPWVNISSLFSASRGDVVSCLVSGCFSDNAPGQPGDYAPLALEATALAGDPSGGAGTVVIGGATYPLVPLRLAYSFTHTDNLITLAAAAPPDASYTAAGGATVFANGYLLGSAPPGALTVSLWLKKGAGQAQDYATVACPQSLAWVAARNYTHVQDLGFALPVGSV